jgi:hypothetical protein
MHGTGPARGRQGFLGPRRSFAGLQSILSPARAFSMAFKRPSGLSPETKATRPVSLQLKQAFQQPPSASQNRISDPSALELPSSHCAVERNSQTVGHTFPQEPSDSPVGAPELVADPAEGFRSGMRHCSLHFRPALQVVQNTQCQRDMGGSAFAPRQISEGVHVTKSSMQPR